METLSATRWLQTLLSALALSILTTTASLAAPFENTLAQRLQACTACHGDQGRAGPDGYYPRLAGKPAGYLYNQLVNFREGRRHYGLMTGLLDTMDDSYLQEIAQYFSSLELPHPKPVPSTASAALLSRGQQLATRGDAAKGLPACTQCHGSLLTGVLPQTPGLLGLPRDYLNAQLGGWKAGQRHASAPDCMADIARKLSDADANAVTHWLSSQVVPFPAKPASSPPPRPSAQASVECGKPINTGQTTTSSVPPSAQLTQGAYLARIGNCAACHTARGGAPFAGGKRLDTDFGQLVSSNLTPHPSRGIGAWSPDDFWQAMHDGKSRDGRLLYPAFPYTHYTQVSRADSDAILVYLRTLAPSGQVNTAHDLRWPYNTQWALSVWRWLYFKPAPAVPTSPAPGDLARGSYLVNGLGHCSACHAPRNRLGAIDEAHAAGGGEVAGSRWLAPSLQSKTPGSLGHWSQEDLVQYLTQGQSKHGNAHGPMAEVVLGGTQYLEPADAQAMARYLLPESPARSATRYGDIGIPPVTMPATAPTALGPRLYEKHCASCHGQNGQGVAGAYPPLAGSATVNALRPNNLIQITVLGGFAPATAGNPRPFGMPPFQLQLNNQELAALVSFVRVSWGNTAAPVSEFDINKLRPAAAP
ncbi:MAG: hypothetical protein CFE43_15995 [Burkholderiales bacterium PBB3]|nr:MAG: hypothetical protein CFE43_15995 [Burkholderiales bacterium PBB3]